MHNYFHISDSNGHGLDDDEYAEVLLDAKFENEDVDGDEYEEGQLDFHNCFTGLR